MKRSDNIHTVTIIGAGKVGSAMARIITAGGYVINKIISRTGSRASALAGEIGCDAGTELSVPKYTDLVLVAVSDDVLETVIRKLVNINDAIVVHTAGSYGLGVFTDTGIKRYGVLYPLQSFSQGREMDLSDVPVFVEAESGSSLGILKHFAKSLSARVIEISDKNRLHLHLAAVFASNFLNHMLTAASEISTGAGIDFSLLEPLVKETFTKAFANGPENSQTGPAVRNDLTTIEKHLELLSYDTNLKELYEIITKSIIKSHAGKNK